MTDCGGFFRPGEEQYRSEDYDELLTRFKCARGPSCRLAPRCSMRTRKPADPVELRVYRGADGAFTLYEDEGDGYHYEQGSFATIPITWSEQSQSLVPGRRTGEFPGMLARRTFRVVWVRPGHGSGAQPAAEADTEASCDGSALTLHATCP